jgi:pyrroline-5-carboxylate reductase
MNWSDQRVAFVGTGQMAAALAAGFTRTLLRPDQIRGFDPLETARQAFRQNCPGCQAYDQLSEAVEQATIAVLAVKPQVMPRALADLSIVLPARALVVSVAAGITLRTLSSGLPAGTRILRVMPNTPCLIGQGASGLTAGAAATRDDLDRLTALLQTVGIVEVVSESLLDAVTGLSGSGPAYVFQFIEALSDGGVKMGLSRVAATRLAAQTVAGAAQMLLQTGQHPAILRDSVTSPGGTTIAGLHVLESHAWRGAVISAVEAATLRSRELGRD